MYRNVIPKYFQNDVIDWNSFNIDSTFYCLEGLITDSTLYKANLVISSKNSETQFVNCIFIFLLTHF